jgi:hypothetical protein
MELATNLLKYANGGEIWLLKEDGEYLVASLDRGSGIENLTWALKRGTTVMKNSLGIGLYQLNNNEFLKMSIFTKKDFGTVILLKPKNFKKTWTYLIRNYMDMKYGGDFFIKKGNFFILGDVSGHGIKAYKSYEIIREFFQKRAISCLKIDDLLKELHFELKSKNLRSVVLALIKQEKDKFNMCGVGNIESIIVDGDKKLVSFKEGIVGEVFGSVTKIELNKKVRFLSLFSDGIDKKMLYNISNGIKDIHLFAICAVFFSKEGDDRSIFVLKGDENG